MRRETLSACEQVFFQPVAEKIQLGIGKFAAEETCSSRRHDTAGEPPSARTEQGECDARCRQGDALLGDGFLRFSKTGPPTSPVHHFAILGARAQEISHVFNIRDGRYTREEIPRFRAEHIASQRNGTPPDRHLDAAWVGDDSS